MDGMEGRGRARRTDADADGAVPAARMPEIRGES
jgi:hypothetical protein